MPLDTQIESLLFWKGEPLSLQKIATILQKNKDEIQEGLKDLEKNLEGRGIQLIYKDDEVMLGTQKGMSSIIETLIKEELVKDLGKAGLETLTIILYRGPIARRDIDYIRGVNSNFILRNLLVRGLIERVPAPGDQRSFHYKPTFELLAYLGINKVEDLPEFSSIKDALEHHEAHESTT